MLHLMESGFFGKQLLNEGSLSLSENLKVRIFQSFYNFHHQETWILVDGIPGKNTANAMKGYFPKSVKTFDELYGKWLADLKTGNMEVLKQLNNIHNLRALQAILCLAGAITVIPDGVLGPITKAAIKEKLGVDDITKVSDDALKKLTDEASANVKATDMSFEADGFKVDGAAAGGTTDANAGKTDANAKDNTGTDNNTEIEKSNAEFKNVLSQVASKVAKFVYKYGEFKSKSVGKDKDGNIIGNSYEVYDTSNNKIAYLPFNTEFYNKAKKEGFVDGGCWYYDENTNKLYFYKCGANLKTAYIYSMSASSEGIVQMFKDDFQKIINKAKGYYEKLGTYEAGGDGGKIFYNSWGYEMGRIKNFYNKAIYDAYPSHQYERHMPIMKGCWQYFSEDGSFWIFDCSLKGKKLTTANAFRYKP